MTKPKATCIPLSIMVSMVGWRLRYHQVSINATQTSISVCRLFQDKALRFLKQPLQSNDSFAVGQGHGALIFFGKDVIHAIRWILREKEQTVVPTWQTGNKKTGNKNNSSQTSSVLNDCILYQIYRRDVVKYIVGRNWDNTCQSLQTADFATYTTN